MMMMTMICAIMGLINKSEPIQIYFIPIPIQISWVVTTYLSNNKSTNWQTLV